MVAGKFGEHEDFVWCQRLTEQVAFLDSALFHDGPFWVSVCTHVSGLCQLCFALLLISPEALHHIEAKLATANLEGTKLVLHQAGENRIDLTALKSSLLSDLLRESQDTVKRRDTQVQNLKAELAARDAILGQANGIFKELRQLYPEVTRVLLADGVSVTSEESKEKVVYITITTRIAMSKEIHQRTEDWLKVRLNLNSIVLNFDTEGQPLKR